MSWCVLSDLCMKTKTRYEGTQHTLQRRWSLKKREEPSNRFGVGMKFQVKLSLQCRSRYLRRRVTFSTNSRGNTIEEKEWGYRT